MPPTNLRQIDPADAERLVSAGRTLVLDVRTPGEYDELGHIPGAWLLPLDVVRLLIAVARR